MAVTILGLQSLHPGLDLAAAEPQLTADPETGRTSPLTAQVIERLDADVEHDRQLFEGERRLEDHAAVG